MIADFYERSQIIGHMTEILFCNNRIVVWIAQKFLIEGRFSRAEIIRLMYLLNGKIMQIYGGY